MKPFQLNYDQMCNGSWHSTNVLSFMLTILVLIGSLNDDAGLDWVRS